LNSGSPSGCCERTRCSARAVANEPAPPAPDDVENSWLNKSLEDRIQILRKVAPTKADAISILVNDALKEEWKHIGHTPTHGKPYQWRCDEPTVTKKGGA
jgi:hypothetical protein